MAEALVKSDAEELEAAEKGDETQMAELTKEDNVVIDMIVTAIGPIVGKLGFGGMVGFCSGYALKISARFVAATAGVGFVCLQTLQYCGYIEIKWPKIRKDLISTVDSDNSGTVGVKDVRHYTVKLFQVLRFKGPPAAGFGFGLYMGFMNG